MKIYLFAICLTVLIVCQITDAERGGNGKGRGNGNGGGRGNGNNGNGNGNGKNSNDCNNCKNGMIHVQLVISR